MKTPFVQCLLIALLSLSSVHATGTAPREQNFNQGWRFLERDQADASSADFDDRHWRELDLPHDWSIEDRKPDQPHFVGPFDPQMEGGHDVGWLRGGTAWYRKTFTLEVSPDSAAVYLYFDGVMVESEVWVNGTAVGNHVYGYTPFYFDITDQLNPAGQANTVAVRVHNPENHSRWFTGSGIYRDVKLIVTEPVHIAVWGVGITAEEIGSDSASLAAEVSLVNRSNAPAEGNLKIDVQDPDGRVVATAQEPFETLPGQSQLHQIKLEVANPKRWDLDTPHLYHAVVSIERDQKVVDRKTQVFGLRTLEFSATKGFLLNGNPTLLKGGCIHHDNGLLGAKAFRDAEFRKVRILKENGFNAIRSAHNPPSHHLIDACDFHGMLLIDESFDQWTRPKRPNDYHQHYEKWWEHDTRAMVMRSRNHPSIIMWSIGNEIEERADPEGLEIARRAIDLIRSIDPTRPITLAFNGFWDNPDKEWDDGAATFAQIDIGGYNYQFQHYESDHQKHPNRIMYGGESMAMQALDNWMLVEKHPYVIGDFVWTAWDYLGEATVGKTVYVDDAEMTWADLPFHESWPYYHANCGDLSLTGLKKAPSFFRDVMWRNSSLEMLVHEPVPDGRYPVTYYWGWPREHKSWSWEGHEGTPLKVTVYSRYPEVALELNGSRIATQTVDAETLRVSFEVPYANGTLTAIGIEHGVEKEHQSLVSTGAIAGVQITFEETTLPADRDRIAFATLTAVDAKGKWIPHAEAEVTLTVEGPAEWLSGGNAHTFADGSLQDQVISLHEGRAQAILRSTGERGVVRLTAESPSLPKTSAVLQAIP